MHKAHLRVFISWLATVGLEQGARVHTRSRQNGLHVDFFSKELVQREAPAFMLTNKRAFQVLRLGVKPPWMLPFTFYQTYILQAVLLVGFKNIIAR